VPALLEILPYFWRCRALHLSLNPFWDEGCVRLLLGLALVTPEAPTEEAAESKTETRVEDATAVPRLVDEKDKSALDLFPLPEPPSLDPDPAPAPVIRSRRQSQPKPESVTGLQQRASGRQRPDRKGTRAAATEDSVRSILDALRRDAQLQQLTARTGERQPSKQCQLMPNGMNALEAVYFHNCGAGPKAASVAAALEVYRPKLEVHGCERQPPTFTTDPRPMSLGSMLTMEATAHC